MTSEVTKPLGCPSCHRLTFAAQLQSAQQTANELVLTTPPAGAPTTSTWDADGNLAQEDTGGQKTDYTWDSENRLVRIDHPDGTWETNTYRADGLRNSHEDTDGLVYFIWDGQNVLLEKNSSRVTRAIYTQLPGIWGGAFSFKRGADHYFLLPDLQGHTRHLANAAGAVTHTFIYDAWGREIWPIVGTGVYLRPFGQWGYWRDAASRLYVRARHLRVDLGRWVSRDPIGFAGGDWNLLAYGSSGPVRQADPSGRYVVLVRGGEGNPTAMSGLAGYIASRWKESVLQPLYSWTLVPGIPKPSPPGEVVVLQVLQQIRDWLASSPPTTDPHGLWLYGHSYGGHIVGQIASSTSQLVTDAKRRIEREFCVSFVRHVVSVVWAAGYPHHFYRVGHNLYDLAGDKTLQARGWPSEMIWWWNPTNYNMRGLGGPLSWLEGGRDHVIQPSYRTGPHFTHVSFDGQSELASKGPWRQQMQEYITQFLMAGHP